MNNNIIELLYNIKNNIKIVEGDDYDKSVLDAIETDFLQLLELIKLFLISERDTYYGYFLMNMVFKVNYSEHDIAGIKLNTIPPVFSSNPLLLCKFSLKNIIYIVCHEIDHVVFDHPALMAKEIANNPNNLLKFNIAADAAVNDGINLEIKEKAYRFMEAPTGCITSKTIGKMIGEPVFSNENYAYYFELIKDKSIKENAKNNMLDNCVDRPNQNSDSSKNSKNNSKNDVVTINNVGKIEDHNWQTEGDHEDVNQIVKEIMNTVLETMDKETRGKMPEHFLEQIKLINRPAVISWQSLLKKYVGTISANKRKTKTRLNRRQPERFDIPGRVDEKILKIVVAIDTSGSMSDEMIGYVFNEIFSIIGKRKHEITVIECDAEINKVYVAKKRGDINTKVTGRGGTSFTPVIEYINNNRKFRDALLIYFTDGFGDLEIPKPKTYRNLWVVFDDVNNLSIKNPYGSVITMK